MNEKVKALAWSLSGLTLILAVLAWGQSFNWQFSGLSTYQIFPLFGLVAFSLMWSHYVTTAARLYFGIDKALLKKYFEITSGVVLVALLLHPGLLAWQLWRDGLGLPPSSYKLFVARGLYGAVILGITSWLAFILFEFHRKFDNRPWWKYIDRASDLAMIAIFIHGLRLGTQLGSGWFRMVWFIYGLTLVVSLAYIYLKKYRIKAG